MLLLAVPEWVTTIFNMPILTETEQPKFEQSVYLEDKDKVLSFSSDMDEHDISHNLRVNEYGEDAYKSSSEYFLEAAKNPQLLLGRLKDTILTKVGLHPDKDAIGARAVISLNEIERVRNSDLSDEEKGKEISAIHDDIDKYLAGKGIYTRATQDLAMNDFMLNVGMAALGAGAISKFGALAFTKGLLKFAATSAALKYGAFPAMKYVSTPEGQDYEYRPLSLSELIGIKTEQAGLKTGADILEMGIAGAIMLTPKMILQAKITTVVKEALPKLQELFIVKGIKIPKEGLSVDYVLQMTHQSPELGTAIMQAADALPFYKALGMRGSALIPKFKAGDIIKVGTDMAKVIKTEGENIVLSIAGKEIIKKMADLAKEIKPEKPILPLAIKLKDGTIITDETATLHSDIIANRDIKPDEVQDVGTMDNKGAYQATKIPDEKGGEPLETLPEVPKEAMQKAKEVIKESIGKKSFDWQQRGFITSIQDEMPEIKAAGQYVPRSTDRLAIKAKTLIKEDIAMAEKMAKEGIDDAAIATGSELLKYYSEEAGKLPEGATKDALYEKAAELGNDMARRLTELGRSVQAASILSRLTPEGQIRFAAKTIQKYNAEIEKTKGGFLGLKKKIPELTAEQVKDITDSMKEIEAMPDGEDKAIRFRDLQDYISDLVPTPLFNKIVAVWKAGLLTGIKTSGVNILANFSHAFGTEVVKDVPAVAVDSVVALVTGKRTVAFTTKGTLAGIKSGFNKGVRFLKTGYDERNVLTKYDYKKVSFGKSKLAKGLRAYEESIFKLMGTEDQPFYYGAKARSLYEQAKVQSINKGLKGKEAAKLIDELVANPTDEMLLYAVADAETAVFQNKTGLSQVARKVQETKIGEFIVPFGKTPSAVAMQIINYSPVGIVKTIFETAGKGKFSNKQREFSQGMGRGLLGVGILALGAYLFRKGMVTLDRPTSEGERKMWELEGRKANSIKMGDKYRSVQIFGPAGNLILIGAQFQNAFNKVGSPTGAIIKASLSSAKSFSEQTFLTGISSAVGAVTQPEREAEGFAGSLISSIIPTIVKDIAQGTDPKARRAENIPQKLVERVPILRQTLEPQIDILGQERMRKENFLEVLADPTRPSTEINEPVTQEIRRLIDAGNKISTSQVGDREGYKILTQKQNTELWQRAGQIAYDKISALMSISAYDRVPDDVKAKKIDEMFDKAKLVARVEKVIEITQGLQGEDLRTILSEAKKDGLLNREVYNYYQRLR